MAETVSDALLQRLIDWGVDTIFGLPGDGINGFVEALRKRRDEVRFVHTRHEETAALAACSYAKFTGRLVRVKTSQPIRGLHVIVGKLKQYDGGKIVVTDPKMKKDPDYEIPLDVVKETRLEPEI